MVHNFRAPVNYSYILVGCVYNVIRAFSDVFVLWGTWRVLIRHEEFRPTMEKSRNLAWTTTTAVLLLFLTLYHLCLLFALAFAWLSFADLDVINAIAEARNGFEIAFTAVQFITTLMTVLWAVIMLKESISHYTEVSHPRANSGTGDVQSLTSTIGSNLCVPCNYPFTYPVILRSCNCGPTG